MNELQKGELTRLAQDKNLFAALESYFQDRFMALQGKMMKGGLGTANEHLGQLAKALILASDEVSEALDEIKNLGKVGPINKDNINPAR